MEGLRRVVIVEAFGIAVRVAGDGLDAFRPAVRNGRSGMGILPMIQPFKARATFGHPTVLSAPRDMDFRTAGSGSLPDCLVLANQPRRNLSSSGFYTKHDGIP